MRLEEARNLPDLVTSRAEVDPEGLYLTLYGRPVTYRRLHEASRRYAGAYAALGLGAGDSIVIVLPTCEEFFFAFYGALFLGAVPVPIYPTLAPELKARVFRDAGARAVVTVDWFRDDVESARAESPGTHHFLTPDRLDDGPVLDKPPDCPDEGVCFIQYTSGSTATPRGVVLSHANIIATIHLMADAVDLSPADTAVSWLPLYHDMGLIGCGFTPLYTGTPLVLLPPDLRNPRAWLEAITEHRGTLTVAPDFGYRNCLRHVQDSVGLDLRSLRMAMSGAEPVRVSTIRAFEERFGLRDVFSPAYGLAEATLAVAIWPPGKPVRLDPSEQFVSVGRPCRGIQVEISGSEGRGRAPAGEVGEILVRGPGVMQGYHGDPEATRAVLRDGWLHTGDLGCLDGEGYLFITGRVKDVIVIAGENVVPADIEEIVDGVPGVRYSAAVGVESVRTGTQRLHVVAEVRDDAVRDSELSGITRHIVAEIHRRRGLRPGRVLLVRPHTIPKTSSGKLQRAALASQVAAGSLGDRVLHASGSSGT